MTLGALPYQARPDAWPARPRTSHDQDHGHSHGAQHRGQRAWVFTSWPRPTSGVDRALVAALDSVGPRRRRARNGQPQGAGQVPLRTSARSRHSARIRWATLDGSGSQRFPPQLDPLRPGRTTATIGASIRRHRADQDFWTGIQGLPLQERSRPARRAAPASSSRRRGRGSRRRLAARGRDPRPRRAAGRGSWPSDGSRRGSRARRVPPRPRRAVPRPATAPTG